MPSILVTGAGRGFGRALCEVHRERGWTVFPLLRSFTVAAELKARDPERCHPIVADVARDDVEARIAAVLRGHTDALDLLVNNAGNIRKLRGLERAAPEDLVEAFRVHCVGAMRCTRAALPFLERSARPWVVNVSSRKGSIAGVLEGRGTGIYSYQIAKAAQNMLSACLDHELSPRGIRVLGVHPGRLLTEVGPPDADTSPDLAAARLADWLATLDRDAACGLHDVMAGSRIEW